MTILDLRLVAHRIPGRQDGRGPWYRRGWVETPDGHELVPVETGGWPRLNGGEHSAGFVRYHGDVIELVAYAADSRVFGRVDLGERRLTDVLNATADVQFHDVRVESLADGHDVELPELTVPRDELYAVVASGPRGEVARRLRTHTITVEVDLGPYHVAGAIHGTPAADPLGAVFHRAAWVPLTDVTLTYRSCEQLVIENVTTLIVNRALARSFKAVEEVAILLPWEAPRPAISSRVRAVDLTGTLQDEVSLRDAEADPTSRSEPPL